MKISEHFEKYKSLIDLNDLKIKFLINQYKFMPNSPDLDDILYCFFEKNKKSLVVEEIVKFFGVINQDKLNYNLGKLVDLDFLILEGVDTYSLN